MLEQPDRLQHHARSQSRSQPNFERLSFIFESTAPTQNPSFKHTKNTLLIILLCISVYSLFYLAQDFVNIILLGFLLGVAYGKLRERFVDFWKRQTKLYKVVDFQKIMICAAELILCLLLPWLSHLSQCPASEELFSLYQILDKLYGRSNVWVRVAQIFLFIHIFYNICGNFIDDHLFSVSMGPRAERALNIILAIVVVLMVLVICVLFVTTIAIELRNAGVFVKDNFQNAYNCRFQVKEGERSGETIYCQDKIPQNIKQLVPQIDRKDVQKCLLRLSELERTYLGYELGFFQQNLCTGVTILQQINPNFLQNINTETTGYAFNILFGIFGIILNVILLLTNGVFKLTTFVSIFMVTLSNYEHTTRNLHIFGSSKEQLVGQIAVIIEATCFIALEHLVFSIGFMEIMGFSSINILLSIMLSMVAFIPYVKPSFIMIIMAVINIAVGGRYVSNVVCAGVYWLVSEYIYSRNYSGVGLHKVIINLSVIFGIYQFGVAGILYGPLIIILFQSVYDQLFR